jgi:Xaa-Pro aminopeptidase
MLKPGVTEYEIAAAIEYFARAHGAEEHFTLIGTGKFPSEDPNLLPSLYAPSSRQVKVGDVIGMEITPRLGGYWTQLVRTVQIGEPDQEVERIHKVCCDAIKSGLCHLSPGKRVRDVVRGIEDYVSGTGYVLRSPLGHICGVDLVEARISVENETELTPGMALIIHPAIFTPDGKNGPFFWGETYLVTRDGYERLQKTGDELVILH